MSDDWREVRLPQIRSARSEDSDALSAIAGDAKADWHYSAEDLARWSAELTVTPQSIESRPTFVAEVDGQVAGFAQLGPTPGRIELEHLWVRPAFMRRGIGRALLQRAVREASRLGHMALQIDADPYAEPFYLACGARRCGELPAPIRGDSRRVRPQLVLSLAAT